MPTVSQTISGFRFFGPRFQACWVGLCCLLPSLVSAGWVVTSNADPSVMATPPSQALVMHIHMVHMREHDLREGKAIARYEFHNSSAATMKILQIKPSCGCVTARLHQPEEGYASGKAGEFYLEVDTAAESSGPHEYEVKIETRTGDAAENAPSEWTTVLYRVDVPEKKVTVRPRALIFYQFSAEPTVQTVEITDFREGRNFEVVSVSLNDTKGFVKADQLKLTKNEHGQTVWTFQVTAAGEVPAGRQTHYVNITTNDREFPELRLPILLYGPPEKAAPSAPAQPE